MRFIAIVLILLNCHLCYAQESKKIIVAGHVVNRQNISLADVNIIDLTGKTGTTTNKNGIFYLALPKQPATIEASYLGYYVWEKAITEEDFKPLASDTLFLNVTLEQKTEMLKPVEVTADNIRFAYDKPDTTSILDYEFYKGNLLLLLLEKGKCKLRLVDDVSNTVEETVLNDRMEILFRDCFDHMNVLGKEAVYEVYSNANKLINLDKYALKDFYDYLIPCMASTDNFLYFREYGMQNQTVFYYGAARKSHEKVFLKAVRDKMAESFANDQLNDIRSELPADSANAMGDNNTANTDAMNNLQDDIAFYQKVLIKPTYNPLLKLKSDLYIFDHINDSAYVYNPNGELQKSFSINYHHRKGWKDELIADYSTREVYAKYVKSGFTYLLQIDTNDGKEMNEFKVGKHVFPRNIKINDGFVYYLYSDNADYITNLYRQKIK